MPAELIASKLYIPPLRPNLVARRRLIEWMSEGLKLKRKLTMISAPAGFGKTTLVTAWLREVNLPAAWLSADEADNDLPRFLAYLAAAFERVDEQIAVPLRGALNSANLPDVEKVLAGLINEIAMRMEPLILILDDFHLLSEQAIVDVIGFLLHHQPPQMHLVLTTREDPDLPLAKMRARDQITEIRARDLRFTREETGEFLRNVMGLDLSAQEVTALEDRTEGWAVGLQLAGLSMQGQVDVKSFIGEFSGSHRHILDYLTDEVLKQQPQEIRSFLLQTSILDRLSGPLCDALLADSDLRVESRGMRVEGRENFSVPKLNSQEILISLEKSNLFLIPLDDERKWYRYHQLFSDLLRNQLTRWQPELVPELHRRASQWYESNGKIQAAIEHALQDTDLSRAGGLIEQYAIPMLYKGEVAKVVSWFDRLPEGMLETAPMLCVGKAWAYVLMQRERRRAEVERALQTADESLERVKAGEGLRKLVAGHAASIQAFLIRKPALLEKKPELLIALAQEAQRLLPAEEKGIRSTTALNIGHGYLALADLEAARGAFELALDDGLSGGNYYAASFGSIYLVTSAILEGKFREASQLCETNIERFNQIMAGQYFPPIGALYIFKGSILLEGNHLSEAKSALEEGLDLIRWTGESVAHKRGCTDLARLHAIQGDRKAMLEAIRDLEETWPEEVGNAQALLHRLSLRHWPEDPQVRYEAREWLAKTGSESGEIEVIESVDPLGPAFFYGNIDLAHVLAMLTKENPGAYPVAKVQAYLSNQQSFAVSHGLVSWAVQAAIARTGLFQAEKKTHEALETLKEAILLAAPTGLLRVFLDECAFIEPLLEDLELRLTEKFEIDYVSFLMESMNCQPARVEISDDHQEHLSERELEVLRQLSIGLTYEEIGQRLFLSLNTVQFHVKNIYRKLEVNKRVQAVEKAREKKLI